ncbi:MAG: hypothetical protein GC152_04290 [Alphaproteobacteria bacterium]|nr:hypothetical protein [Alphaproteobacteria bacterium]
MILRRLSRHVKDQNWFAVALDFLIVVAGILIAFQITNWNEAIANRAEEATYRQRLADDLQDDIRRTDEMIALYTVKQELLVKLRDGPIEDLLDGDRRDAAQRLEYTVWKALPGPRRATYDELIGSGKLTLLTNIELRNAVSDYYSQYGRTVDILAEPIGDYRRLFAEYIPGDIPVENLTDVSDETVAKIMAGVEAMRAAPAFERAANAEIFYGRDLVNWLVIHREQAETVLSLLSDGEAP